jgi:hypothetical protein
MAIKIVYICVYENNSNDKLKNEQLYWYLISTVSSNTETYSTFEKRANEQVSWILRDSFFSSPHASTFTTRHMSTLHQKRDIVN